MTFEQTTHGALRGVPIDEYDPDDLGEDAYRAIARVFDENRAARAAEQQTGQPA
jgi:hypothetical protein